MEAKPVVLGSKHRSKLTPRAFEVHANYETAYGWRLDNVGVNDAWQVWYVKYLNALYPDESISKPLIPKGYRLISNTSYVLHFVVFTISFLLNVKLFLQ